MISGWWPSALRLHLPFFIFHMSVRTIFPPLATSERESWSRKATSQMNTFIYTEFWKKNRPSTTPTFYDLPLFFVWFGIGGNRGTRVTVPLCSDDVVDVQTFDFVAPLQSSCLGSILHAWHCFSGLPKPVGHTLGKKEKNRPSTTPIFYDLSWFFLWFGIGGNRGTRVSVPLCSDDVVDVQTFDFVAPLQSSCLGSILHEFRCFSGSGSWHGRWDVDLKVVAWAYVDSIEVAVSSISTRKAFWGHASNCLKTNTCGLSNFGHAALSRKKCSEIPHPFYRESFSGLFRATWF